MELKGLVIAGHRDLVDQDLPIIQKEVVTFIDYDEFDFLMIGGALGTDTMSLIYALEHRGSSSRPRIIVVVPDTVPMQPRSTWEHTRRADQIIELGKRVTMEDRFWAYKHRNEFMIDWVAPHGRLLAFWNGRPSGTSHIINYASRQNVEVSKRAIQSLVDPALP